MQASGLGPAGLLTQHHVPVAVDLPGVGENLQDHLQLRTVYRVRAPGQSTRCTATGSPGPAWDFSTW